MSLFEGSFLGDKRRIESGSLLECGVCWWVYDPDQGDEVWQIPAGTAFADLPEHWRCPNCDAAQQQFMVLRGSTQRPAEVDPPARAAGATAIARQVQALAGAYERADERMRELPVHNPDLAIDLVGFRRCEAGMVGVVVTPWCMNLVLLATDGRKRLEGSKRDVAFPSGTYEFIAGHLDGVGAIETCSLFSPMAEFDDPAVARSVAQHAIVGLFDDPEARGGGPVDLSRRRFLGAS